MKHFPLLIMIFCFTKLSSVSSSAEAFHKKEGVQKNTKNELESLDVVKRVFDIIPNTKIYPQADPLANELKIWKYGPRNRIRNNTLNQYTRLFLKTFFREMKE